MLSMAAKRKPSGLRIVKLRLPDGRRVSENNVWNTSLGGVFIGMKDPLAFGAEVGLEFELVKDANTVRCEGFVVWSTTSSPDKAPGKAGICVRLVNIGISEMRQLAEAVGREM